MAVYAGQGRQPFSAAQLLAMEEERKKQLAINQAKAKTNEPIYFEKDRTWKDKLAGRKSLQGQYWEAYPESAPRGFWGDLAYRHGATSNLFGAPEMQMGNAGIWADEQIDRQEAARNSQQDWSPAVGPNYNPTIESSPIVPPGETYTGPKNLSDEDFARTYKEQAELGMLGRLHYNPDGTFSRLPTVGTAAGDWVADQARAAYENSRLPYVGMERLGGGSIFGPGDWAADQLNRIEADREYNLPENVALREAAKKREEMHKAGLLVDQQLDKIEADRAAVEAAKAAEYEAAGIWADDEITRQETARRLAKKAEEKAKAAEYEAAGIWATDEIVRQETEQLAARRAEEDAKKNRLATIQAGIDADAGRTTQENYELAAGIEWEKPSDVTAETIIETATAAADNYDADAANAEWVDKTMKGETLIGKFLDMLGIIDGETVTEDGQEKPAITETEANESVKIVADLAEQSKVEAVVEVKQDGLLATNETATSLLDVPTTALDTNIFTAASDDSTEGFTMDRLKNPLSAENKAWWLGGGGGIPGNNRAVEFFNTLAYIGTPLKYRPAKTPSETLQERKIQHLNNLMDYKAASSTSDPTFSALRAAVPSYNEIKDVITPRLTEAFDFGWFGKSDSEKNTLEGQITAAAAEIRARMIAMAMAGQTSTVEKEMAKLIKEAEEAEKKRKEEEAARIAAERAAKDNNDEPGIVDKALTTFKGFF